MQTPESQISHPFPGLAHGQAQSAGQLLQFSPLDESQVPLPQVVIPVQTPDEQVWPGRQAQSAGQVLQFSPLDESQVPSPHVAVVVVQVPDEQV